MTDTETLAAARERVATLSSRLTANQLRQGQVAQALHVAREAAASRLVLDDVLDVEPVERLEAQSRKLRAASAILERAVAIAQRNVTEAELADRITQARSAPRQEKTNANNR
ncbi:MAG TPA: hypothetical protein VLV45_03330 [Gemmatimonadales bacterium]|nr:hypothetical protein [Gemmatimonadales bacterium]